MRRPKLHKHQYPPQAANEAAFEFYSKSSGGLLTLTDTGEKLIVDLFRLDDTVEVRAPEKNLMRRTLEPEKLHELVSAMEEAVSAWNTAKEGDSNDAEYDAATDLADAGDRLAAYLRAHD